MVLRIRLRDLQGVQRAHARREKSCTCEECHTVCEGRFPDCPKVWARGERKVSPVATPVCVLHGARPSRTPLPRRCRQPTARPARLRSLPEPARRPLPLRHRSCRRRRLSPLQPSLSQPSLSQPSPWHVCRRLRAAPPPGTVDPIRHAEHILHEQLRALVSPACATPGRAHPRRQSIRRPPTSNGGL